MLVLDHEIVHLCTIQYQNGANSKLFCENLHIEYQEKTSAIRLFQPGLYL
jgi:hypothetical protein